MRQLHTERASEREGDIDSMTQLISPVTGNFWLNEDMNKKQESKSKSESTVSSTLEERGDFSLVPANSAH